jgi:2-(3-amino-3-carboxypropyl)histidine synthase
MDYDFEVERIVKEVEEVGAHRVGLQFPEGLKDRALDIAGELEEKTGCETVILSDSTYGACDLKTSQAEKLGLDLVVHFGHTEFKR